jgi:hypothetical protein
MFYAFGMLPDKMASVVNLDLAYLRPDLHPTCQASSTCTIGQAFSIYKTLYFRYLISKGHTLEISRSYLIEYREVEKKLEIERSNPRCWM